MAKSTSDNMKQSKKRPGQIGEFIGVRVQLDLAKALDDWRRKQDASPAGRRRFGGWLSWD